MGWFLSSVFFVVLVVLSCNKLSLLVSFVLLLLVWYGTSPNCSVCFARGDRLDLLTGVFGAGILFLSYKYLGQELASYLLEVAVIRPQCWCGPVCIRTYCDNQTLRPTRCLGSSPFLSQHSCLVTLIGFYCFLAVLPSLTSPHFSHGLSVVLFLFSCKHTGFCRR